MPGVVVCVMKWWPKHIALATGIIYAGFGGHRIYAFTWNIIYAIGAFIREEYKLNIRTITAFGLPILLCVICLSALPCLRHHFHNSYEIIHRYLSWLALCLLIIHVIFVNIYQVSTPIEAIKNPPTIFTIFLIILTIYPCIILHRINGENIKIITAEKSTAVCSCYGNYTNAI